MKVSELRIGNYVEMGTEGIGEVSGYNIYQKTIQENGGSVAEYYHHWKPIPLTEEWLVKFGFLSCNNKVVGKICFNVIYSSCCEIEINRVCIVIKYVHEFQNIYHILTGEELGIK